MSTSPTNAGFAQRGVALLCLLLLCASGCRVAPPYIKPAVAAPPAYKELSSAKADAVVWQIAYPADTALRSPWWSAFNDPQLDALEQQVATSNQNIAAAAASYQAALAIVRETRSRFFPALSAGASATNARISAEPLLSTRSGATYTEYTLPIEAAWEPDLWGAVRNNVRAAEYNAQAGAALLANVRLAQQAQAALLYFSIEEQDSLAGVTERSVRADQDSVDLSRTLYRSGLGSEETLASFEARLHQVQAQRENIRLVRAQYEHALAVLLGKPPAAFTATTHALSDAMPSVPVALPSVLLQRRPDIAGAERSVAAANAEIGQARAAYFPSLTLSGDVGFTGLTASDWLTWPSRVWSAGPAVAETVFDAGLRRATVHEYRAREEAAAATYRQTVLTAFQQVEDQLAALHILDTEIDRQSSAVAAAQRATEEAETRYRSGLDPYLNVVEAQQTLLAYEQSLVELRFQRLSATVQLIQALGGGWDAAQLPSQRKLLSDLKN